MDPSIKNNLENIMKLGSTKVIAHMLKSEGDIEEKDPTTFFVYSDSIKLTKGTHSWLIS